MSGNVFDHLQLTYFQECAELLDAVYVQLSLLEEGGGDDETVHAIFRAVHSIKGGGGAFGFDRMVAFAHVLETMLDLLRDDKIAMERERLALLLRATDALSDLIAAERTSVAAAPGFEDGLLAELDASCRLAAAPASSVAAPVPDKAADLHDGIAQTYLIRLQPHAGLFLNASEPLLFVRELRRLGPLQVTADLGRLPTLDAMDPETAYIGWTIALTTGAPLQRIRDVFEFVSDQCDLAIDSAMAPEQRGGDLHAEPAPIGIGLAGLIPANATPAGPGAIGGDGPGQLAAAAGIAGPEIRKTGVEPGGAGGAPHVKEPMVERTEVRRPGLAGTAQSVRVDVEKVDRLVNLVGELVINQAMLIQLGGLLPPDMCPGLISGLDTLSQHLRELQEGVMAIRTQPVKSVFSRMPRLVRELSAQLGKEARLTVTGEATEIDKTVIEQLADPLTHLLRNAIDHGIERPEVRVAQGKPAQGSIHLGAEHRSGRIIIEVSDDGRGIDRARVLARARSRGMVAEDVQPSDEEIDQLIFLPGFSTAETVSNISGRGVGMDVVRRNIQALGGRIAVQSRQGDGSRFLLSLPLTLAILDGMIVAVGAESYIVPLTNIVESLRPRPREIHAVVGCGDVVAIRGQYVPLLYLASRFGVPGAITDPSQGIVVVVETEGAAQIGLVVDELIGQQQVVVKSLEGNYGVVDGVGGATILGNGRVALILDVAGLHGAVSTRQRSAASAHTADGAAMLLQ